MRIRLRRPVCCLGALGMLLALAAPAPAQFFNKLNKLEKRVNQAEQLRQKYGPMNDQQEIAIGQEVATQIVAYFHIYQNPEMTQYVNMVGQTVAAQSERQDIKYHFAILDSDEIEAMSTPGGFIFITRGALKLCDDESELAGVLAHEVGHVAAKHVLKMVERDKILQQGMDKASAFAPGSDFLKKMSSGILKNVIDHGLDPADEYDADARAVRYAYEAGYPADGLERFLVKLNQATNQGAQSFWTRTHPPVPLRNERMQRIIARNGWGGDRPTLEQRYMAATAVLRTKPGA